MEHKKRQCNKTFTAAIHPSIKIGGFNMGQCPEDCLPGFVVCYEHANKEALFMRIVQLERALEKVASVVSEVEEK